MIINTAQGGAGSIKEMYDFPLSMQATAPTPINTNHIWIQNDRKLWMTVDEAIRADWSSESDCYFAIVDRTANNIFYLDSPKKLTDGTNVLVNNRHIGEDWNNGYIHLSSAFPPAKKYGINYWVDNWIKPPRIYSRINGVIDMETAYRWDGNAWQYLSQKGHYLLAIGNQTSAIWNRADAVLTPHANQLAYASNAGTYKIAVTKDGLYTAVGLGKNLYIYKRIGDSFSLINQFTMPIYSILQISFSPDGSYLAVAHQSAGYVYKKQSDGSFALLADLGLMGIGYHVFGICWSPTGDRLLAIGQQNSSSVYNMASIYTRSGDTFTFKTKSGSLSLDDVYNLQWPEENLALCTTNIGNYSILFNPNTLSIIGKFSGRGGQTK